MKYRYTKDDLSFGKLVTPDTYTLEIAEVQEGTGTDEQTGDEFEWQKVWLKIVDKGPFEGVRILQYADERYPSMMRGLLEALTGRELSEGENYELSSKDVGKRVKAEIVRGSYKSKKSGKENPSNQIEMFFPAA